MAKQIFNSFKELQGIILENKVAAEDISKKDVTKKQKKTVNNITKPGDKKLKKSNNKFSVKPVKLIDPKLQAIFDALNWLKTSFPKAFINSPAKIVPLKIGLGQDIIDFIKAKENPEVSLTLVRKALSMYTNNFRYLIATTKSGNPRIDLQGNTVGEVTAEQAQYAQSKLTALKERRKNKTAQEQSAPQEEDVIHQQNN